MAAAVVASRKISFSRVADSTVHGSPLANWGVKESSLKLRPPKQPKSSPPMQVSPAPTVSPTGTALPSASMVHGGSQGGATVKVSTESPDLYQAEAPSGPRVTTTTRAPMSSHRFATSSRVVSLPYMYSMSASEDLARSTNLMKSSTLLAYSAGLPSIIVSRMLGSKDVKDPLACAVSNKLVKVFFMCSSCRVIAPRLMWTAPKLQPSKVAVAWSLLMARSAVFSLKKAY
mmetsp:Transcript_56117/g.119484  ORF Transcript_56117/g.119484 Transcript_56117/m.119484 type:complete len:230 (-) Transcript_56117:416-1105(-)